MSSKRGRKRNDNLPPNRARDVQRAFRARRAAHLQALEVRVSELEEENNCLRQALNLPPANRQPLGKGPTGKDKPKPLELAGVSSAMAMSSGRDSSNDDSPASRTSSLSPCALTVPMPARSTPVIGSGSWDDTMLLHDQQSDVPCPPDSPYGMPMSAPVPMSAPSSLKPLHHYSSYTSSSLPSSRNSMPSLYVGPTTHYPGSSDRVPNPVYDGHSYLVRSDIRDEPPRHYPATYPHSTFQATEVEMQVHTPPPSIPAPQPIHRESSMPYPHRRSLTEPQGYTISQGYLHLAHSSQLQQDARNPDYPQLPDSNGQPHHPPPQPHPPPHPHQPHRSLFGADGHINSMS